MACFNNVAVIRTLGSKRGFIFHCQKIKFRGIKSELIRLLSMKMEIDVSSVIPRLAFDEADKRRTT